jgi:hypothetical protein
LKALAEYSLAHDYPVEFSCELTINVAHDETLLELLHAANFTSLFVGIESPRRESLLETKKGQNTRRSIVDDVKRIQAHDISVMAGMIVGFDSDDQRIFREQYSFLQDLGTPFTTCGTLVALPNTPLMKRLQSEGRMLDLDMERVNGHGAADCNFVPRQMTRQELFDGYSWLQRSLYRYDSFSERLVTLLSRYQTRRAHKRASPNGLLMRALVKVLAYYLLTLDRQRFWFFTSTAWKVAAAGRFSVGKWLEFFRWMAFYPSLRAFVVDLQGMPEMANPARPPFEGVAQIPTAAARASLPRTVLRAGRRALASQDSAHDSADAISSRKPNTPLTARVGVQSGF